MEKEELNKTGEAGARIGEKRRDYVHVDENGQIILPAWARDGLNVKPGDSIDFITTTDDDVIMLKKSDMIWQELPPDLYQKVVDAVKNKTVPFRTPEEFVTSAIEEKLSENNKNN